MCLPWQARFTVHCADEGSEKGSLVGIASVAGIRDCPVQEAYCASKAAVISYCESLRGELRDSGISVLTVSPGYVATPLTAKIRIRCRLSSAR